jgi:hypothetical protein
MVPVMMDGTPSFGARASAASSAARTWATSPARRMRMFHCRCLEAEDPDVRRIGGLLREHGGDAEERGFDESERLT